MELLYASASITRQAFHQWARASNSQLEASPEKLVLELASYIRTQFLPGSGARELYAFIRGRADLTQLLRGWGKHRFEALCLQNGLRIIPAKFRPKTTIRGAYTFPNLIEGRIIFDINKIWVSDISYIFNPLGALVGYATSLIDIYSRRLLGLEFSQTMKAVDTVVPVINQAFKIRKQTTFPNTTFHSDAGSQYIATTFLNKLNKAKICSSMARNCYENPFAEAFNDTLKNHVLPDLDFNSFVQLKKYQSFICYAYNQNKPHTAIHPFTPIEYEKQILNLKTYQRTPLKIKVIR